MNKPTVWDFFWKEKLIFFLTVIFMVPMGLLFSALVDSLAYSMGKATRAENFKFILTYHFPILLALLITVGIAYYFVMQHRILVILKRFALYHMVGAEFRTLVSWIAYFFGAVLLLILGIGYFLNALNLWYALPGCILVAGSAGLSIMTLKCQLNQLNR